MKKILSIVLALVLCCSLAPFALAAGAQVVLSAQELRVDGAYVDCEKYNIDGSNYFKLRDLAYLMNGTGSQFSIGWDGEKGVIAIVTGEAYTPVGGELVLGADKSETAVPSAQTITINGEVRDDLSAYNIGGNNYFKLRDLGEAVGFFVDYDPETRTMLVFSSLAAPEDGIWVPVKYYTSFRDSVDFFENTTEYVLGPAGAIMEETYTTNNGGSFAQTFTYDGKGNLTGIRYDGEDSWEETKQQWDENGWITRKDYTENDDYWESTVYTYDAAGQVIGEVLNGAYDLSINITRSYDAEGNLLREVTVDNSGMTTADYTYDAEGRMLRIDTVDDAGFTYSYGFEYDAYGNVVREYYSNSGGSRYDVVMTYDSEGRETMCRTESDAYIAVETWVYDDSGNLTMKRYETTDKSEWNLGTTWSQADYTPDAYGNPLTAVNSYSDGTTMVTTHEYTYDAEGHILRDIETVDGEVDMDQVCVYDAAGNLTEKTTIWYWNGAEDWRNFWSWEYACLGSEEELANYEASLENVRIVID